MNLAAVLVGAWTIGYFYFVVIPATVGYVRGRVKHPIGCCHSCNYNLTGNISGICPECGTPIPEKMKEKLTPDQPKE